MTETDKTILDIESRFWRLPGRKDAVIRDTLDLSPTRYYQHLNRLIDSPEALEHSPVVVNRLRRLRHDRQRPRRA